MKKSVITTAIVASAIGANGQNSTAPPLTVTEYYSSCPPSGAPSATQAPGPSPVLPPGVSITIFNYIGQELCGCKDIYTDKTYTVTETCKDEELGQPKPTDYVPQGFKVTTSVCDVCGPGPVTKTATCPDENATPAPQAKAPAAAPAPAGGKPGAPAAPAAPAAPGSPAAPAAPGSAGAPAAAGPPAGAPAAAAPAGGSPAGSAPAAGAPAAAPAAGAPGSAPAAPAGAKAAPASPPYPAGASQAAGAAAPSGSAGTNAKVAPFTGGASNLLTNALSNICAVIGMAFLAL